MTSDANDSGCGHDCEGHDDGHVHSTDCGHEPVLHEDHVDYLVDGHLHHQHGDHCDHHGVHQAVSA